MIKAEDYKNLAYKVLRELQRKISKEDTYIDWSEIEHIAFINLDKAARLYNPTKSKAKFTSYAYKVIKRAIARALHFYKHIEDNSDIDNFYKLESKYNIDSVELDIDRELNRKALLKKISTLNSTLQTKKILALFVSGYSIEDIAEVTGCNTGIIYGCIDRHKDKLSEVINGIS